MKFHEENPWEIFLKLNIDTTSKIGHLIFGNIQK